MPKRRRIARPKEPPASKPISTAGDFRAWAASYEHIAGIIGGNHPEIAEDKLRQAAEWRRYAEYLAQSQINKKRMKRPPG